MKKNYSKEDLIQLAYNESNVMDTLLMKHCIDNDEELKNEFLELVDMQLKLDELKMSPSKSSIQIIMAHSRKVGKQKVSTSS